MEENVISEVKLFYNCCSFTSKFKNLLHKGLQATLTFKAKDGEAFVNLKAGLGLYYDHNNVAVKSDVVHRKHSYFPKSLPKSRSPAYLRRQEKRRVENNRTEACTEKKAYC